MITRLVAAENDHRSILDAEPSGPDPKVTVCIPVYNRVDLLRRTLAGFAQQSYPRDLYEVVVGDDGSEEDVEAAVASLHNHLEVRIVRRERDGYGAGQARNLAAAQADGQVLIFVDADCLPHTELIADHVSWHRRASNLVVIGARQHFDSTSIEPQDIVDGRWEIPTERGAPPADWREVFYRRTARLRAGDEAFRSLVSSNFSVRAEHFRLAGGFEEAFSRWGGEDTELGWRLWVEGLYFVADDRATVFHQTQEDEGPGEGWRQRARALNDGIVTSLIPHRFYRRSVPGDLYAVPKVSWVVSPVVPERVEVLWEELKRQSFTDWELVLHGTDDTLASFAELHAGDPRVTVVASDEELAAMRAARGELVVLLHGWVSLDHRVLGRIVRRLDARPRTSLLSLGVVVPGAEGPERFRHPTDVARLGGQWGLAFPPVVTVRRREWNKILEVGDDLAGAWQRLQDVVRAAHLPEPLVAMPSASSADDLDPGFSAFRSDRSLVLADLQAVRSPVAAGPVVARYATRKLRGRPYKAPHFGPAQALLATSDGAEGSESGPARPGIRYVGWTGRDNLGDEVMLDAVRRLMPWGDVETAGDPTDLLVLGGGTLINRRVYLDWLREKDSPRSERAVFGTGVASPDYWGLTEEPEDWIEFLGTCAYVGVRGPRSAETLRTWGYEGELEVCGDPALALERLDDTPEPSDGRLVISPLDTRGELWGGDDRAVLDTFIEVVQQAVAEGREVWMLSCFPADDRVCIELMRRAGHPDLPYLAGYTDHDQALRLLGSASVVLAERLHAAVLAAATGAPFVAVEYRPKLRDFAASVGQEDVVARADDLTSTSILQTIRDVEARRTEVTGEIAAAVDTYRGRLLAAAERLRGLVA